MPRGVYDRSKNKSAKPAAVKAKTAKRGKVKASGSPALDKARTRIDKLNKRITTLRSTAKDARADASTKFKELKSTSRIKIKAGNAAIRALPRLAKVIGRIGKTLESVIAKTKVKAKGRQKAEVTAAAPAAPKAPRAAKAPKAPRAAKVKTAVAVNPAAAAAIAKGGASAAPATVPATGADATVSTPAAAPAAQV